MSDTPETDYALQGVQYRGDGPGAFPDHARRMERERDEAMLLMDVLQHAVLTRQDEIGRACDARRWLEKMRQEKKIREGAKR